MGAVNYGDRGELCMIGGELAVGEAAARKRLVIQQKLLTGRNDFMTSTAIIRRRHQWGSRRHLCRLRKSLIQSI